MKVIRGLHKITKFKKPVVVLGVFDGVHIGHINILKDAVRRAHSIGGTSIALTFDPHPQKEESLTSLDHRIRLIAKQGIDVCIVIDFNKHFQQSSALDFVRKVLVNKIGARYIYIGKNFRFGRNAEGDIDTLKALGRIYNFKVKVFKVVRMHFKAVSSTYIRRLIKKGELSAAEKLLCRPVTVLGSVMKGVHLGRRLGFPTANIDPHHEVIPPEGVYAAQILLGNKKLNGLCNIGKRPTFMKKGKVHIEVHIFNFHKNIYGKYIEIEFIKKLRKEKKFPSAAALIDMIRKDITFAKTLFSRH
jgi:riboflavin kinase/FMN adenylyltransferase